MSTRSRISLGGAATLTLPTKPVMTPEERDFRKRHSNQNRDIITENAIRRNTIRDLQNEVASLQVELLEVRQANIILQAQVKRLKTQAFGDETSRRVLDQILSAMPALQLLRDSMVGTPASSSSSRSANDQDSFGKTWTVISNVNPTAVKPAAMGAERLQVPGAGMRRLGTLEEDSECGSDAGHLDAEAQRRIRRKSRGRRTDIGSVSASRSPRPPLARALDPRPTYVEIESPASSTPPNSPPPLASPMTERSRKRRRESGLLVPQAAEQGVPPVVPTRTPIESPPEIPDWEEGPNIVIAPTLPALNRKGKERAIEAVEMAIVKPAINRRADNQANSANILAAKKSKNSGESSFKAIEASNAGNALELGTLAQPKVHAPEGSNQVAVAHRKETDASTRLTSPEAPNETYLGLNLETTASVEDDGGRGRRARRSVVSYKEPSLTKKMRKPDGLSAEETLRNQRAAAVSSRPASPVNDVPSLPAEGSRSTAASHLGAMRRKSVLPRPGSAGRSSESDDEEERTDDPDFAPSDSAPSAQRSTHLTESSSSSSSRFPIHIAPPPHTVSKADIAPKPRSAAPSARTSPRKTQAPKRYDGLGSGRPITQLKARLPSGGRTAKERSALADRLPDNGQEGLTRDTASVVASDARRKAEKESAAHEVALIAPRKPSRRMSAVV